MSSNYSPATPVDKYGNVKNFYSPAKVSLASTTRENASTSSILLLSHDTTEISITGFSGVGGSVVGIAGKWISRANLDASVAATSVITAAGSANYDFIVPTGMTINFVVPISTNPQTFNSVQGINRDQGLFPAIAFKSTTGGAASVLTVEL